MLFLDEPTTGLDLCGRAEVWDGVRDLVAGGTTVLLTTQYLDEADQLADAVVVIDHGRAVAASTPERLKATIGAERLDIVLPVATDLGAVRAVLRAAAGAEPVVDTPPPPWSPA